MTGGTLRDVVAGAEDVPGQDVIRPRNNPIKPEGAMAVLRGNLAPRGAVIKHSAATPKLLQHTGRAVVFESVEDMTLRIDDPDLDVTADDVLVLRNAGPKGAPGMPEAGYLPIPKKLARGGVKDMVRISDARMSGTAFGTIVLHITPESAVGGPLALVRNGDLIRLDVADAQHRSAGRRGRTGKAPRGAAPRRHARLGRSAATRTCSTRPSCRPTRAATSISCAGRARGKLRRTALRPEGRRWRRRRRHFPLLVNFFTATRKSSVSMASMIFVSSASSCCLVGVTAA